MKKSVLKVMALVLAMMLMLTAFVSCDTKGPAGPQGEPGANGADVVDGKSAYELAVEKGYTGTVEEWLASLVGEVGATGQTGANGADGKDGANGKDGVNGKSAYELAVEKGYTGTLDQWLASLVGQRGATGASGADGKDGKDGEDGASVTGAYVDENLHLWIVLSDGTKIDAGYVGVTTTEPTPEVPEITEPTIIVSKVSASAGDTIDVAISIKNNPGIAGAKLTVTYNSKLTLISAVEGSALEAIDYTAPANLNSGCAFNWDSLLGEATEDGTVILLTFKVTGSVSVGDILEIACSYVDGDIYDENIEDVTLDCKDGSVTIK